MRFQHGPFLVFHGQDVTRQLGISDLVEADSVADTVDPADPVPGGYSFQWGQGANGRDASEFGGSVWLNILYPNGQRLSGHWDLNLTFEAATTNNDVPEPVSFAVFGLGLIGLHCARRRWSRK